MSSPDSSRGAWTRRIALLLIVLGGAALRLPAVGLGREWLTFQIDEERNVSLPLSLAWSDLNPRAFDYPALLWYMLFVLDRLVFWLGRQYGLLREWGDLRALFEANPIPFFLAGRSLSLLFGVATLGLVYVLGRRLYSPAHGLLAAAFLAGAFLHVRDSALATLDAPTTFFVTLSLLGSIGVFRDGRVRQYVVAAGAAGLATATKYNAFLVLIALVVAHGARTAREGQPLRRIVTAPRLLGGLLLAAVLFVVLNPYLFLDWPKALKDLTWLYGRVKRGQFVDVGPGWWYHLSVSLRYGLGIGLLGLALAGVGRALWRRDGGSLVLLGFAGCFFLVMGSASLIFVRYMTPLLPILCLFAATALLAVTGWLRWPRARPWVTAGLAVAVLAEPVAASLTHGRIVHRADTRVQTYQFVVSALPPGAQVATYGPSVTWRSTIPRFLPILNPKQRHESWTEALAGLKGRGVGYFLTHHSELEVFSPTVPEIELALQQSAVLVREFPYAGPNAEARPRPVYDRVDSHFFPIGGFRGVRRPGPLIRLYRLN